MIQLAAGVTLRLKWLAVAGQASASNLGAGLTVVGQNRPGEAAAVMVQEAALVYPFCLPTDLVTPYLRNSPRPADYAAGVNVFVEPSPLPEPLRYSPAGDGGYSSGGGGGGTGCSNSTAAPLYERCYSQVGTYVDFAGHTVAAKSNTQTNVLWILRNVTSLCLHELDQACVEQLTPRGCLQYSYSAYGEGGIVAGSSRSGPDVAASNGTAAAGAAVGGGAGGGDAGGSNTTAIVCGTVIGGAALALLVAGVMVVVVRRRRRQRGSRQQQKPQNQLHPNSEPQQKPAWQQSPLEDTLGALVGPAVAVTAGDATAMAGPGDITLEMDGCSIGHQHVEVLGSDTCTHVMTAAIGSSTRSPVLSPREPSAAAAVAGAPAAAPAAAGAAAITAGGGAVNGARKLLRSLYFAHGNSPNWSISWKRAHSSACSTISVDGPQQHCPTAAAEGAGGNRAEQAPPSLQLWWPDAAAGGVPCWPQEGVVTLLTPPAPGLALLPTGPETVAEAQRRAAGTAGSLVAIPTATDGQQQVVAASTPLLPMHAGSRGAEAASSGPQTRGAAAAPAAAAGLAAEACASAGGAAMPRDAAEHVGPPAEVAGAADVADIGVTLIPNAVLGKGSFGRVYEGRFRGQAVAVKVAITAGPAATAAAAAGGVAVDAAGLDCWDADSPAIENLRQEVEVLARCAHPNVVKLLAVCLTPPRLCLVMELMETNLYRLLHRGGLLPIGMVFDVAIGVASALEYLHPTITHRDLKPANVLIRGLESGRLEAKLADFGIARLRHTLQATKSPDQGTPGYTAPECFDTTNWVVSHHADMYSFGVMLWEMLTCCEPWKGLPPMVIAFRLVHNRETLPVRLIAEHRGDSAGKTAARLANLVSQCFERDPRRRPAAAEAVKLLLLAREEWAAAGDGSLGGRPDAATAPA
ncbi:hypothetical protein HXX76_013923 [Chlamydomonas incerta]|uniref:Protein kinase domain-containing protein n=1 Tax=Chlamydomonas incerta TaxID=51695 RepID=A0A835SDW8_CHLIN|nr:hypothetical protein HXX76_013923 [Chlamydomonas incerta]|eukprot:KAG2425169.1 hypothetical protein HXX76_013923 [Chlamydomonas incerta]